MPELPDITIYREALEHRILDRTLRSITIKSPFLLRTVDTPLDACEGRRVAGVSILAKRIVLHLEGDLFLVLHLMIAGRLLWKPAGSRPSGKIDLAAFTFEPAAPDGACLILTEASPQKRASLHVLASRADLASMDPGGLDPLTCTAPQLAAALRRANRTLKRALTDPATIQSIGNAYSDEILHAAKLSPILLTSKLTDDHIARLRDAIQSTLTLWTIRLRREFGLLDATNHPAPGRFPGVGDITAFRPDFAAHGKFNQPCPTCATKIARIVRADNECNYCPTCQTAGKLLADRSLSRLLKEDWGKE